jgi:sugar lactone lactonase YvrE
MVMRRTPVAAVTAMLAAVQLSAQVTTATSPPVNDRPNPYQTIEGWAKMPDGRTWGSTSAVGIAADGASIWVAERCAANTCVGSTLDPVILFDPTGKVVRTFGSGLIQRPHGLTVDHEGNVWVTDWGTSGGRGGAAAAAGAAPPPTPAAPKGHQVFKFAPDGKLLMTLGKAGGGRDPEFFYEPNQVLVAPNGDIFVAEGHSSSPGATARVLKLDRTGKLLMSWGKLGNGPDDFDQPHALAMDSRGRLFVGDRGNNRIKIFDQNGKLLDTWYQFSRPSGIFIDKNDVIYVADSESGSVSRNPDRTPSRTDWKRGIRIGSAKDGTVTGFIPDPNEAATNTSAAEGVAVDSKGNVYGAEVGPRALKRYVKK